MSRVEKAIMGILAAVVAAAIPGAVAAYVSLASAQAEYRVRLERLDQVERLLLEVRETVVEIRTRGEDIDRRLGHIESAIAQ